MRHAWLLAAVLAWPLGAAGQGTSVLHVTVTLPDAGQSPGPVPRHALLISDNPSSSAPRRVLTGVDGTVNIALRPGSYTVESDRPVAHLGKAYQWTEMVEVMAGRDSTLVLSGANAEVVPLTDLPVTPGAGAREPDLSFQVAQWEESVVAIWSPTTRASGFLVDARGLIATDRIAVGSATSVEVQLSPTLKLPGRVLADVSRDVAMVWVDPSVLGQRKPMPLPCPPATMPSLDDGQDIVTIATPLRSGTDVVSGEVTTLQPRAVETDLRLSFGGAGGPVFNDAGVVVGLTSVREDPDARRRSDVFVVRVGLLCEAVTMARSKLDGASPPEPAPMPLEPTRAYPADAAEATTSSAAAPADPPVVSSADFDVALMTPRMLQRAGLRADWTGGHATRAPEAEARIGRLTELGAWSEYLAERPPVLIVRITPKMVEGFWKRLGREAARTQGAVLPAFKDFKTRFLRMRASCGGRDVTPIHPFVLEHRLSETDVVREGLYVFDPDAFGPQCGEVSFSIYSEKAPDKADTLVVDPKVIERVWQDFEPWRAAAQ